MARISIAMTTYCGEKYIEKQLNSLLNQKRKADEVLIFDDRSKDNTAQIVTSFIEANGLSNWHFKVNSENLGFIKNFHQALENCTGDIIFLCDQDDIWHDDKLMKIERLFSENPDALSVNASFQFIDGEDKQIDMPEQTGMSNNNLIYKPLEKGSFTKISEAEIVKGNISPGCTMAISRKLCDYYLKNASDIIPHDFELNIYAAKLGGLYFYNEALISYRIHGANVIGMDTEVDEGKAKIRSDADGRIKLLNEQKKTVEFLKNRFNTDNADVLSYINVFSKYVEMRSGCLEGHSLLKWFKMCGCYKYLTPNIPKRWYIGDLIFTLKLQNIFKGD